MSLTCLRTAFGFGGSVRLVLVLPSLRWLGLYHHLLADHHLLARVGGALVSSLDHEMRGRIVLFI